MGRENGRRKLTMIVARGGKEAGGYRIKLIANN
jgi:hypothetical protein